MIEKSAQLNIGSIEWQKARCREGCCTQDPMKIPPKVLAACTRECCLLRKEVSFRKIAGAPSTGKKGPIKI